MEEVALSSESVQGYFEEIWDAIDERVTTISKSQMNEQANLTVRIAAKFFFRDPETFHPLKLEWEFDAKLFSAENREKMIAYLEEDDEEEIVIQHVDQDSLICSLSDDASVESDSDDEVIENLSENLEKFEVIVSLLSNAKTEMELGRSFTLPATQLKGIESKIPS